MILKTDSAAAKERLTVWWNHKTIDRPVIAFAYPRDPKNFQGYPDYWCISKLYQKPNFNITKCLEIFESKAQNIVYGGEWIPTFFFNYGPGIIGAILGIEPRFADETVWYEKPMDSENIVAYLEKIAVDGMNKWFNLYKKELEICVKRAGKDYQVALPSFAGVLDILSFFLGPTKIIVTMRRHPEIIDECRKIILNTIKKVYNPLYEILAKYSDGCSNWLNVWNSKRWFTLQSDFAALLSPQWFKRFVLIDLIEESQTLENSIYHLDGITQLPYIDDLLAIPTINGIQWVPGIQEKSPGNEKWFPFYKKIQAAGKNIVIDVLPEEVKPLYKELNPDGLFVRTTFKSKDHAQENLPSFIEL